MIDFKKEILLWTGCNALNQQKGKQLLQSFKSVLALASIHFKVMNLEKNCAGEALFHCQSLSIFKNQIDKTLADLSAHGIKTILCNCPHCYYMLSTHYNLKAVSINIVHYTDLIFQLIENGTLRFHNTQLFRRKKIAFHDPCYLGRGMGIYSKPRKILAYLDGKNVELKSNKSASVCCGAGRTSFADNDTKKHQNLAKQCLQSNAPADLDYLVTACAFCEQNFQDIYPKKNIVDILQIISLANRIGSE